LFVYGGQTTILVGLIASLLPCAAASSG
jgi:hypothetical protein